MGSEEIYYLINCNVWAPLGVAKDNLLWSSTGVGYLEFAAINYFLLIIPVAFPRSILLEEMGLRQVPEICMRGWGDEGIGDCEKWRKAGVGHISGTLMQLVLSLTLPDPIVAAGISQTLRFSHRQTTCSTHQIDWVLWHFQSDEEVYMLASWSGCSITGVSQQLAHGGSN